MARIRTIKPQFFKHEELFDAEKSSGLPLRIAYAGLWTVCDREGRFAWKPRALKTDVLPYDDCDFIAVLDALAAHGFIMRYEVDGKEYGCVPRFSDHQLVNRREAQSVIPGPEGRGAQEPEAGARTCIDGNDDDGDVQRTCMHVHARGEKEGKGREKEKEGKENNASATHVSPEMVAQAVRTELGLAGRELLTALDAVCRYEPRIERQPRSGAALLRDGDASAHPDPYRAGAEAEVAGEEP